MIWRSHQRKLEALAERIARLEAENERLDAIIEGRPPSKPKSRDWPWSYRPQDWRDGCAGGTPITASALNRIEKGIARAHLRIEVLERASTSTQMVGPWAGSFDPRQGRADLSLHALEAAVNES